MIPTAGLPALHAGWLAELLDGPIPAETIATCDACVMAGPDNASTGFLADTKCCTYMPELHNFQVGAILATDGSEAGRESVRARIARKAGVSPLGLARPRSYLLLYDDGGSPLFGRSRAMRCPHYVDEGGGSCGIWQHREATCATYFCKFVRGRFGAAFWQATQRLLAGVERGLAWHCVVEQGFDVALLEALLANREATLLRKQKIEGAELDGGEPTVYRKLWGSWLGREEELYRACAERVAQLSWSEALAICDPMTRAAAAVVRSKYAALVSSELPPRLRASAFQILGFRDDTCRLSAYSATDAVEVPVAVIDILPRFDGRLVETVLQELAEEEIEVELALVRKLVDLGLLVATDAM